MATMRKLLCCYVAFMTIAVGFAAAEAQPWVGEPKQLSAEVGYTFQTADTTYETDPVTDTLGEIRICCVPADSHGTNIAVEYVPIEKLAVGLGLMTSTNRYTGERGMVGTIVLNHGSADDGSYHFAVTDMTAEVRYQLLDEPLAFTPYVRALIPVTDYEVRGYAAQGKGLQEYAMGFWAGKIGLFIPRLWILGSFSFSYVQDAEGDGSAEQIAALEKYTLHHSDANMRVGYIINDKFTAYTGFDGRITHGGFDLENLLTSQFTDPISFEWHDPLLQQIYISSGLGLNYNVNESLMVGAGFNMILWGNNVSNAKIATLNVSWSHSLGEDDDLEEDLEDEEEEEVASR